MSMFRGEPGERGPQGDHGQDGLDGAEPFQEPERMIAQAIAENRMRWWDRRLLIIVGLILTGFGLLFWHQDRQEDRFRAAVTRECEATNEGNAKVNDLLDQLAAAAALNGNRTPEQRDRAAATYTGLRLPITDCPR